MHPSDFIKKKKQANKQTNLKENRGYCWDMRLFFMTSYERSVLTLQLALQPQLQSSCKRASVSVFFADIPRSEIGVNIMISLIFV